MSPLNSLQEIWPTHLCGDIYVVGLVFFWKILWMESSSLPPPLPPSTSRQNEAVYRVHEALRSCAGTVILSSPTLPSCGSPYLLSSSCREFFPCSTDIKWFIWPQWCGEHGDDPLPHDWIVYLSLPWTHHTWASQTCSCNVNIFLTTEAIKARDC